MDKKEYKTHTNSPESFTTRISPERDISSGGDMDSSSEHVTASINGPLSNLYHGTWPVERGLWQSGPSSLPSSSNHDMTSVMSFASSAGSTGPFESADHKSTDSISNQCSGTFTASNLDSHHQLGAKVDIVYGLLAMLGANEGADMGHTLLALSSSPESCLAMRKSGCIPLLVQLVHSECDALTRQQASQALHNLVQAQPDERLLRRETRVLKLLEQIRIYCENIVDEKTPDTPSTSEISSDKENDKHPAQIIANLMKLSFDEGHRIAICQLGGLQAIAKLIQVDHLVHGSDSEDLQCITLRRYAGMALTNLTFGDGNNKALLCSLHEFMQVLVKQLYSNSEDLKQVTASVLRNLSWRADSQSKQILREVGAVVGLAYAAMNSQKEATLKSVLSALWNLSAHCSINKADICSVDGLLGYLVEMLTYKSQSKTLSIIENAGGILRNISSHIAVREDYRAILRQQNCLQILLQQLRSPSLTVVSNACGSLWNLSAKCPADQKALWDMGAVPMLRSLTHSKHKMISMGSSAALKNLLGARPNGGSLTRLDSTAKALGLTTLPTLGARKQRALEQELDENLTETCDNIEPSVSPTTTTATNNELHLGRILASHSYTHGRKNNESTLSESRESVTSTHSDSVYERVIRNLPIQIRTTNTVIPVTNQKLCQSDILTNVKSQGRTDLKFIKRYEHSHYEQRALDSNVWSIKNTSFERRSKFPENEQNIHNDQPIDYSQKYSEEATTITSKPPSATSSSNKSKVEVAYGNYTVTDLDQPTNYSLRYPEDDSNEESSPKQSIPEYVHEDTVKTYCTEGTPYETPFNFSTATSMSDLRLDGAIIQDEKKIIDNDYVKEEDDASKPAKEHESRHLDEKDTCSIEDITKIEPETKYTSNYKSGFNSSGILSPEKPVNYCEEGTPGYFSRVSSLSSLNSTATNENALKDEKKLNYTPEKQDNSQQIVKPETQPLKEEIRDHRECKVVTFGGAIDYAEETPLMFSRSSSLASLDSVEQHSIHDDRSSVISDFSRRTSGVVSPSELPDSPTQTVPPTPVRPSNQELITPRTRKLTPQARSSNTLIMPTTSSTVVKQSVFEDATSSFKDENTPIEFSRATSLSSLTIDDEIKPNKLPSSSAAIVLVNNNETDKMVQQMSEMSLTNRTPPSPRHTGTGIPIFKKSVPKSNIPRMRSRPPPPPQMKKSQISERSPPQETQCDVVKTYYTEDTPAVLSHAGSNSNLSELSIPLEDDQKIQKENENGQPKTDNNEDKKSEHDNSFELSGDENHSTVVNKTNEQTLAHPPDSSEDDSSNNSADERLLQQCIQAGMNRVTSTAHTIAPEQQKSKKIVLEDDDAPAFSDDSYTSADERLLQQCIKAGMARVALNSCVETHKSEENIKKRDKDSEVDLSDDSVADKLLQDCIQLGMDRVTKGSADARLIHGGEDDDNASITSADERLLTECINLGIQSVTGEKPQISPAFVQQSQSRKVENERPRLEKRSRSMGYMKKSSEFDSEFKRTDDSHIFNSKQKGITNRFSKSESSHNFGKASQRMSSTLSLDSATSLNDSEKLLLEQCIQAGVARATGQMFRVRPENRKPIGAERDDNVHQHHKQNSRNQTDFDGKYSETSSPYPHPAYRESSFTTRVVANSREIQRTNITVRENSTRERIISREEFYSTRVPNFEQKFGSTTNFESKNVEAPPVTASTAEELVVLHQTPHTFHLVTGAEKDFVGKEIQRQICKEQDSPTQYPDTCGKLPDEYIHRIENSWIGETKNGYDNNLFNGEIKKGCNKSLSSLLDSSLENNLSEENVHSIENNDKTENELVVTEFVTCADENNSTHNSDESSFEISDDMKYDYVKPRDPDAMIASVDRLTAELVSQASHLHTDRLMKQSVQDTWNNDTTTSSADLTFPSISATEPIIVSIKSETTEPSLKDEIDGVGEANLSSLETNMTDSTIIAAEAYKVVKAVENDAAGMIQSTTSSNIDIENIKPPSNLGSLTSLTSISGVWDGSGDSENRKKPLIRANSKRKLSATDMMRKAITNSSNHSGSLENLINQTTSLNLDCIKPPSIMNEISDMESSMISVASITSEVAFETATIKPDFIPNGVITTDVFDMEHKITSESKQPHSLINFIGSADFSFSDIENVNPPSYFNEHHSIIDTSTNNDTICDDDTIDIFEDCNTHNDPTLQKDDLTTEYSDANSVTPLPSDFASSSAESTPKKVNRVNKRLTPKQRRQLTKERYKTYTVAAGLVIQEEPKRNFDTQVSCPEPIVDSGKGSTVESEDHKDTTSSSDCSEKRGKLTPKQRRQEDRQRFQTQVLDCNQINGNQSDYTSLETDEKINSHRTKKTVKQKRLEDKERFRTRTIIDDIVSSSPDSSLPNADSPPHINPLIVGSDELHNMIQHEASRIVDKLNENVDELLDCETISLVSNEEDESEHNSMNSVNFRTYHKSWGFSQKIPIIDSLPPQPIQNTQISSTVEQHQETSTSPLPDEIQSSDDDDDDNQGVKIAKPKIVKPGEQNENDEQPIEVVKGIRGRRKPLYNGQIKRVSAVPKILPKNTKTVTSNLVKNVSSNLKSSSSEIKPPTSNLINRQVKPINKNGFLKPPIKNTSPKRIIPTPRVIPTVTPPSRIAVKSSIPPPRKVETSPVKKPVLERQGTFTKEDGSGIINASPTRTRIPLPSSSPSKIAKPVMKPPVISKLPKTTNLPVKKPLTKSSSVGSSTRPKSVPSVRSSSSRSSSIERDQLKRRSYGQTSSVDLRTSPSNQNLKSNLPKPNLTQRSYSNSSIPHNTNVRKKIPVGVTTTTAPAPSKEITSKIASLWKKVEMSRNQKVEKKDTRVWIQQQESPSSSTSPRLLRSSTFEGLPKNVNLSAELSKLSSECSQLNSTYTRDDIVSESMEEKNYTTHAPVPTAT
ncbi:uncharacterized protein LOC123305506 isoform X2 [Chrysoperla carnea]|nr:uncharacterized protein LOC123305506 isoform X2 [Chrysoperla carnea]